MKTSTVVVAALSMPGAHAWVQTRRALDVAPSLRFESRRQVSTLDGVDGADEVSRPRDYITAMYKKREADLLAKSNELSNNPFKGLDVERINGRVAMVAWVIILAREIVNGESIVDQISSFFS